MVPTGSGELAKFDEGAQLAQTISAAAWAPAKVAPVMAASWSLRPQLSPAHGQASCCFRDNLTTQEDPSVSHLHLSDLSSCLTCIGTVSPRHTLCPLLWGPALP